MMLPAQHVDGDPPDGGEQIGPERLGWADAALERRQHAGEGLRHHIVDIRLALDDLPRQALGRRRMSFVERAEGSRVTRPCRSDQRGVGSRRITRASRSFCHFYQ